MAYGGHTPVTATIADNASLSGAVALVGSTTSTLVGIITPAGWTTAGLEFQGGLTIDGTFYTIYNASGAKVATAAVAASTWVALDPGDFAGVPYIKVRSATSGTPVVQSGGDALTLIVRSL